MAERILNRLVEAVISLNEPSSEASNAPKMNQATNENKTEAREAALRQLFPSIRGQSSSHSAASASVSASRATNGVFNPSANWSRKGKKRGNKKGTSAICGSSGVSKAVLKDVVLLPSPKVDEVPRGQFRETLYSKNFAASAVEFSDEMQEEEIRCKCNELFERKLRCCSEPKFYFVRAVGNKIVELNSGPFTGKVAKQVSKQGPLYIRVTTEVHDESLKRWYGSCQGDEEGDDPLESEEDESLMDSPFALKSMHESEVTEPPNKKIHQMTASDGENKASTSPSCSGCLSQPSCSTQSKPVRESQLLVGYNTYVNMFPDEINVDDENCDEDVDLHAAIQASLADQRETDSCSMNEAKASDVLREFVDDNLDNQSDSHVNVVISRKNVLSSALRALERGKFSFVRPVHIMFSGEDRVDSGGPRREFFRLLMMSLKNLGIFYGTWFSHDLELLHGNKYELAGKLVAWSVLQGGPGPKCLSLEAFSVMKDLPFNTSQAIEAVCDEEIKEVLKGLQGCVSEGEFNAIKESGGDLIANHGYSRVFTADFSKKSEIQHCLLKQVPVCVNLVRSSVAPDTLY